ncbi:survival of motor neuron-related-splicing factor 30 [Mytilus galloprovincialis]|uniref:Survival of motor neuron-related-splicing factor 30 n=1 Tax=Mytilus galloprovincialis TaxID=29158 RepID=A0A8B6CV71_MYTGA|nr:survival of motor neuron-related-splicing factor 30 [Mytilus galloprovincialis]
MKSSNLVIHTQVTSSQQITEDVFTISSFGNSSVIMVIYLIFIIPNLLQAASIKLYYGSKIDEILEDGTCTVTFDSWGNTEVTNVTILKPIDPNAVPGSSDDKHKSKRDKIAEQREYKKKKTQKKAQRLKAQEEERETEKNKWLDFNAKTFSKTNKGKVKKSIFATPDHVNGKVGVGTCGQSGKPMTKYTHQEKWKK